MSVDFRSLHQRNLFFQQRCAELEMIVAQQQRRIDVDDSQLADMQQHVNALLDDLSFARQHVQQLEQRLASTNQTAILATQTSDMHRAHIQELEVAQKALKQQNELISTQLQQKTTEFDKQRALRRAADAYIADQKIKKDDLARRLVAAEALISQLGLQKAELTSKVEVQSARIKGLEESHVLSRIETTRTLRLKGTSTTTTNAIPTETTATTNAAAEKTPKTTIIVDDNTVAITRKQQEKKRSRDSDDEEELKKRHCEQVVADGLKFIDEHNEREKPKRDFNDAVRMAAETLRAQKFETDIFKLGRNCIDN